MAKEAERNVLQIQTLFAQGQAEERRRAELIGILGELCADAIDLTKPDLKQVIATGKSVEKWERIGTALSTSNLIVNSASGFSALVAMGAMSRGRKPPSSPRGASWPRGPRGCWPW